MSLKGVKENERKKKKVKGKGLKKGSKKRNKKKKKKKNVKGKKENVKKKIVFRLVRTTALYPFPVANVTCSFGGLRLLQLDPRSR